MQTRTLLGSVELLDVLLRRFQLGTVPQFQFPAESFEFEDRHRVPARAQQGCRAVDLALGKPVTASSTHPGGNGTLTADRLTGGSPTTRWAAADDATYPVTLDIGFGADTAFDEVHLDEYTGSGTNPRVQSLDLQRWDAGASRWITFATRDTGIGDDLAVTGFGAITTSRLRVALTGRIAAERYTHPHPDRDIRPQERRLGPFQKALDRASSRDGHRRAGEYTAAGDRLAHAQAVPVKGRSRAGRLRGEARGAPGAPEGLRHGRCVWAGRGGGP
ncbi:hypothetical protein IQ62_23830 [Streptomyces scabiei]|uniref:discoidin domain-containing protein n=1 Tax=Streptomyces scabiei TaxID=1930 RepID=UPI0004E7B062|nr:hypothetical protein [Streptomyces scabiei]KFF98663.1 hypothetical protein IQ62_23830 [Streptomyces scabiei]